MLNLLNFNTDLLKSQLERFRYLLIAALFGMATLMPIVLQGTADAATLSSRKVTINTSRSAATAVQYDFTFSWGTATDVESVIFQFCTTALGTCTLPNAMDVSNDLVTLDSHTNFPTNGTAFAEVASNTGGCSDTGSAASVTMYCINRTEAGSATGTNATVDLGAIINPTIGAGSCSSTFGNNFCTVYVRISLYDNSSFSNSGGAGNLRVYDGAVAAAIVRQITVNGRVAERLDFCVGAVTDSDAGAPDSTQDVSITGLTDNSVCTGTFPSTSTVDIGVVDDTAVYFSPVNTTATNGALDNYGLAAVKTNASNGVVVTFYAEDATSVSGGDTDHLKAFRVVPTNCEANQTAGLGLTDQCFESSDATGEAIAAGTEEFGMKVACFYQNATYSTTTGLTADANYADAATANAADCENTVDNTNYAWNETGVADTISSSTGVVDDELIKFEFGASTSSTTPTGSYTVVSTYIATPTF